MSDDLPYPSLTRPLTPRERAILSHRMTMEQQNSKKSKSCTQVESFVSHENGSQDSGELKLDETRTSRIVIRFTKEEKEYVGIQAEKARMPVSHYVRLTLLKRPSLDPERNELLHKANFELTKQGTNLNQIAKHLNAGAVSIERGDSMLAMIARSLLSAHRVIQQALAEGKRAP